MLKFVRFWCVLSTLLLGLSSAVRAQSPPPVSAVGCPGMTVSSLDRAVDFYTRVLTFTKTAEYELAGTEYEHREGVFGLRKKVAHLTLGDECLELTEYLTPPGLPVAQDSTSNDLRFQHIAIVVGDLDRAYSVLREHHVSYVSSGQRKSGSSRRVRSTHRNRSWDSRNRF